MRSPRRRRKRLLDVEDAARTRTVPRGCEAAHWDAHNRRGPFSTAERYSIVDVIDPRRSLSAPTPVSRAEECGRGREGDVAFGDAPITKYHPRGPGLRLVKRVLLYVRGEPARDCEQIGTRIHTPAPGTQYDKIRRTRSIAEASRSRSAGAAAGSRRIDFVWVCATPARFARALLISFNFALRPGVHEIDVSRRNGRPCRP